MIPLPKTLALLIPTATPAQAAAIEKVFQSYNVKMDETERVLQNLRALGEVYRVKVWFSKPIQINYTEPIIYKRKPCMIKTKMVTEHIFTRFFHWGGSLCYQEKANADTGWKVPEAFPKSVIRYEPQRTK